MDTAPAFPPVEAPEPRLTRPLAPELVVPELKTSEPLTPLCPALDDVIVTAPLGVLQARVIQRTG